MQNQQLLFLSAQAPDGYKLICTGAEMRWISTQKSSTRKNTAHKNAPARGDEDGKFVFVDLPDLPVTDNDFSDQHHHHHHHHQQDDGMHGAHQSSKPQNIVHTAALMELACPEQTFLELQQSSGVFASAVFTSFVKQHNHYESLPESPYVCLQHYENLSRGPPVHIA